MNIFKRFEIWVLLLITAGITVFVIVGERNKDAGLEPGSKHGAPFGPPVANPEKPDAAFTVDQIRLKRDYGNAILEIQLTYDNKTTRAIELVPPVARLLSGPDPEENAEEVRGFFLAFSPPPSVPASQVSSAVLKYWLEPRHLGGPLWLQIVDDREIIKTAAPFDLESIPNQEDATFTGTDWAAAR